MICCSFENLATPQEETDFCDDYKLTSKLKGGLLFDLYNSTSHSIPVEPLNLDEIKHIVRSCKNGKAQDGEGISAEHFKYAGEGLLKDMMFIINRIMQTKFVPPKLLHGVLTPILKKSKDKKDPANYRGITCTVIFIIGKLLEKAWLLRANPIIEGNQSRLQHGLTAKCSSINAAFLITESIAEAKDTRKPLYITFLDASKVFDVVDHSIMMNELHPMEIEGDLSPDSDSTLVDSDSDSTSVDSDSSAVDSDSGLMDSDSDSTQLDSDSQWVQVSPVRKVQGKFKLSCAIMDEILRGRN